MRCGIYQMCVVILNDVLAIASYANCGQELYDKTFELRICRYITQKLAILLILQEPVEKSPFLCNSFNGDNQDDI